MTEMIVKWITELGYWGEPSVDALDSGEGCGIFPMGKKLVRMLRNIVGGNTRVMRYHWRLKVHLAKDPRRGDDRGMALLEALGVQLAEVSGYKMEMENARLVAQSETMARYEADLYWEDEE